MAIDGTKVLKVKMDLVMDIARRVSEDINDLEVSRDQWGSEDFADALTDVSALFNFASAVMLTNAYVTDYDGGGQMIRKALEQAVRDTEDALSDLRHFGFSYTIDDLVEEV